MESSSQSIQDQTTQSQSPLTDNSSGSKVIPIILGVAAAIVIAIGAYLLGTKQSQPVAQNIVQPTSIPSPTPVDETANWKTYADRELGFEFKYPNKFGDIKDDGVLYRFLANDDFLFYFSSEPKKQHNPIHSDEDCGTLKNSFLYCRYLNSKTGWIFIRGGSDFIDRSFSLIGQPNALQGNTNKISKETNHPSNNSTFINFNLHFSEIEKIPYEERIKLEKKDLPDDVQRKINEFDQILSTFKFSN